MTVPYLGSKISLISKAEIRYEGILYSIDQTESTVALAKVKSFGTEDRPTDRPVPPRDEVFEYIIFRGRDIKDLHVCAPPQPMPHDPAIVQSSDLITTPNNANNSNSALSPSINPGIIGGYQSPQSGGMPPSQMMMYPPYVGHPPPPGLTPPQKPQGTEDSPRLLAPIGHPSTSKTLPGQHSDLNPPYHQNIPGSGNTLGYESGEGGYPISGHQAGYSRKDFSDDSQPSMLNNDVRNSRDGVVSYRPSEESRMRGHSSYPARVSDGFRQSRYQNTLSQQQHHYHGQQYTGPHYRQYTSYRGGPIARGHQRGGYRRPGGPRGGIGSRLKFEGEFDFESSNAQFDKEQIEKELKEKLTLETTSSSQTTGVSSNHIEEEEEEDEGANQQPPVVYYDKSKSFFDNLSCDATEKERGKPNWREERKLNCETFGLSNTYSGSYYRGGRGYRSRPPNHYGHYGGARGGWSYSNRGFGGYNRGVGSNRRGRGGNPNQDRT